MIHTLRGPARRRIAVVEVPRLGRIRGIQDSANWVNNADVPGWATTSQQTPSSAEQWMAAVIGAQSQQRETKPGTLTYTVATPNMFAPPVQAPWNSWGVTQCAPDGMPLQLPAPAPAEPIHWLLIAAGVLTGAASLAYLMGGRR